MKVTLAALNKLGFPYHFEEDLDLTEDLKGLEDILKVNNTNVKGSIFKINEDTYKVSFKVSSSLVLESSISLKEVLFNLDINFEEYFTTDINAEDAFVIEGQTLDTKEAVITNILINKPMSQSLADEEFESAEEVVEEEPKVNEAFKSLKDLL